MFPVSCFVEFVRWPQGADHPRAAIGLLVNRMNFHIKAVFSSKENMIAVGFKLGKPPAHQLQFQDRGTTCKVTVHL